MLTCLVVFNMSVGTSREMVRCGGQGWGQAVAGHVSADDMAGADQEVGLPLGDEVFQAGGCH